MLNLIVSIDYLRVLFSEFKAVLQNKLGYIKQSDEVEEFGDKSDEDEIIIRFASERIFDMDGSYAAKFFVGQVPEGFILGSRESYMRGKSEIQWFYDNYYLNFEAAELAVKKMVEDWLYGDDVEEESMNSWLYDVYDEPLK